MTLYHLDLSYNNLGSTSCQAFLWGIKIQSLGHQQKMCSHILCKNVVPLMIATKNLQLHVYLIIYIIYTQSGTHPRPSPKKAIWQSLKACNVFLFSLGSLKVGWTKLSHVVIWWIFDIAASKIHRGMDFTVVLVFERIMFNKWNSTTRRSRRTYSWQLSIRNDKRAEHRS